MRDPCDTPRPSRRPVLRAVVVVLLTFAPSLLVAGPARAAVKWFYSPTGNLGCEVADRDTRGSYAYCQSVDRPQSVRMASNGRLRICRGEACLGNGPEDATRLAYGRTVRVGRFACSSSRDGFRCRVVSSGRGFFISKDTIRRI